LLNPQTQKYRSYAPASPHTHGGHSNSNSNSIPPLFPPQQQQQQQQQQRHLQQSQQQYNTHPFTVIGAGGVGVDSAGKGIMQNPHHYSYPQQSQPQQIQHQQMHAGYRVGTQSATGAGGIPLSGTVHNAPSSASIPSNNPNNIAMLQQMWPGVNMAYGPPK
jgi:hypothetical protein